MEQGPHMATLFLFFFILFTWSPVDWPLIGNRR